MIKVILVGGFHEIIELCESNSFEIIGIIDTQGKGTYRDYKIICDDANAVSIDNYYREIPLIITPDHPITRERLFEYYLKLGFKFATLVSNKASISKSAIIYEGCVIQASTNVSAESVIGKSVKLNTMCNIMHNVKIGDFSTIAPNSVILGNVSIGKCCYIGSNSTILPNISICDKVIIGAGAVVTKNIVKPGTYIGAPAKLMGSS
jgi:sugar O-acyltransferase (sialic acid O-acetyltransferase NeuD family)